MGLRPASELTQMDLQTASWLIALASLLLFIWMKARRRQQPAPWIPVLFFFSGFPALIYQIVWQRALFSIYGMNAQSVTIVVSGFMLGLGLGSLLGGLLSKSKNVSLIAVFAIAECATGVFGFVSLPIFHRVAEFTAGTSLLMTGLISFSLVVLPTLLMGATLPLLTQHLVNSSMNVGYSVGLLYFVNTLGSGLACLLAADVLMRRFGQSGSVRFAALLNVSVGLAALVVSTGWKEADESHSTNGLEVDRSIRTRDIAPLSFPLALGCAAFSGFFALSYEILWFRLLAFATSDTASAFALLLAAYLVGLAFGSRFIEGYFSRPGRHFPVRLLVRTLLASSILSFAVAPLSAFFVNSVAPTGGVLAALPLLLSIVVAGVFFGATFPVIAHASVRPGRHAGRGLSHLYAANIAGSTLGAVLVGFVLTDHFSTQAISLLLLVMGLLLASSVYVAADRESPKAKGEPLIAAAIVVVVLIASRPLLGSIYDRLLFKNQYPGLHFQRIVENRSGVIGVSPEGVVWGGGVYDGRFNIDLLHDVNIIVRPYALAALQPSPRRVLMIGLGSGSWAQVVANHPQLEELTVVEINPGYLHLIPDYAAVASLLHNPKVHIIIDDGRRWLLQNKHEKFDAVVMNTSYYWRNHSSNLLSQEFLQIVRKHLNRGGVFLYNTTGSDDVIATGLSVFPYGFRIVNALAVSDSPLVLDRARWMAVLLGYIIDGKHIVDRDDAQQMMKLKQIVNIPEDSSGRQWFSVENNDHLRARLKNRLIITDDNMGLEWRSAPRS
jgi:predicted membrane-bound spermidine synthase